MPSLRITALGLAASASVALALAGCDACRRSATPQAAADLSPVVQIQAASEDARGETTYAHLGSGFRVSEAGHVVTAYHVVENFRRMLEAASEGDRLRLVARVGPDPGAGARSADALAEPHALAQIADDPDNDLALLKAEGWPRPDAAPGIANLSLAPPAPETAIVLAGYPFGARGLEQRSGRIIVSASAVVGLEPPLDVPSWFHALGNGGFLLAEVETHRGNSGSPVSRADSGDVVGLCSAILLLDRSQPAVGGHPPEESAAPFTLVIPSRTIAALLDANGVDWHAAE